MRLVFGAEDGIFGRCDAMMLVGCPKRGADGEIRNVGLSLLSREGRRCNGGRIGAGLKVDAPPPSRISFHDAQAVEGNSLLAVNLARVGVPADNKPAP